MISDYPFLCDLVTEVFSERGYSVITDKQEMNIRETFYEVVMITKGRR